MRTFQQEMEELRRAGLDFAFHLTAPFQWLALRLGMTLKPWVQERRDAPADEANDG